MCCVFEVSALTALSDLRSFSGLGILAFWGFWLWSFGPDSWSMRLELLQTQSYTVAPCMYISQNFTHKLSWAPCSRFVSVQEKCCVSVEKEQLPLWPSLWFVNAKHNGSEGKQLQLMQIKQRWSLICLATWYSRPWMSSLSSTMWIVWTARRKDLHMFTESSCLLIYQVYPFPISSHAQRIDSLQTGHTICSSNACPWKWNAIVSFLPSTHRMTTRQLCSASKADDGPLQQRFRQKVGEISLVFLFKLPRFFPCACGR